MAQAYAQAESIVVYPADEFGGGVLFNSEDQKTHVLNETAYRMFQVLAGGADIESALDELKTSYDDIGPEELRSDLAEVTEQLIADGILVHASE